MSKLKEPWEHEGQWIKYLDEIVLIIICMSDGGLQKRV